MARHLVPCRGMRGELLIGEARANQCKPNRTIDKTWQLTRAETRHANHDTVAYFPLMRSSLVLSQVMNRSHRPLAARLLVTLGATPLSFSTSSVVTTLGSEL